jgi:hypothetical protein
MEAAMADEAAKTDGFRSALVGGVVGAIATAVAGVIIVSLTNVGNAITDWTSFQITRSVIAHSKVYLREGESKNGSDFSASCQRGELVVGGQCVIQYENGVLQNAGTTDTGYECTYSRRADANVKARIYAACLGLR